MATMTGKRLAGPLPIDATAARAGKYFTGRARPALQAHGQSNRR